MTSVALDVDPATFKRVQAFVQARFGIALRDDKQRFVAHRLHRVVRASGLITLRQFMDHLEAQPADADLTAIVNAITTNHTYFWRESQHFEYLRDVVLPKLARRRRGQPIRLWCAAASRGHEPYTLAMLARDALGPRCEVEICATDLCPEVLSYAQRATYPDAEVAALPAKYQTHFTPGPRGQQTVCPDVRALVRFEPLNLTAPQYPHTHLFDAIFARNVFIYFNTDTTTSCVRRMLPHMAPDGTFFVGLAETLRRLPLPLRGIQPGVYEHA